VGRLFLFACHASFAILFTSLPLYVKVLHFFCAANQRVHFDFDFAFAFAGKVVL
jgi:hypothetical protein